jgi:hypothetical protein
MSYKNIQLNKDAVHKLLFYFYREGTILTGSHVRTLKSG